MYKMRYLFWIGLFLTAAHMQLAIAADEEDENSGRKIIYRQKTEIDFEGLEVEGEIVKPSSSLVLERKKAAFNPLVKIRTDWVDLIDESIDEAK
jgi:hypothetical protein